MTEKEILLYCTVRLKCNFEDGTVGAGTGFFYNIGGCMSNTMRPFIVTNDHVIKNAISINFKITLCDSNFKSLHRYREFTLITDKTVIIPHPNNIDLCIISITDVLKELHNNGERGRITGLSQAILLDDVKAQEISPIEDILMIGYPDGIYDEVNNLPIVRRGITATSVKEDYNGEKEFLIDIASFNGSSGSPVFICHEGTYTTDKGITIGNRIALIGIMHSTYLHSAKNNQSADRNSVIVQIPNNLGIVAKATELLSFNEQLLNSYFGIE